MEDLERELIKAVSVALTDGQGTFTERELLAAFEQVREDLVGGAAAQLVLEGLAALTVEDGGEVLYKKSSNTPDLPDQFLGLFEEDRGNGSSERS